jgi:hypothetical protein
LTEERKVIIELLVHEVAIKSEKAKVIDLPRRAN